MRDVKIALSPATGTMHLTRGARFASAITDDRPLPGKLYARPEAVEYFMTLKKNIRNYTAVLRKKYRAKGNQHLPTVLGKWFRDDEMREQEYVMCTIIIFKIVFNSDFSFSKWLSSRLYIYKNYI